MVTVDQCVAIAAHAGHVSYVAGVVATLLGWLLATHVPRVVRAKRHGSIRGVRGCARCGHDHRWLLYQPFERPIVDELPDGRTVVWAWWARCPRTGDPVLLANRPTP